MSLLPMENGGLLGGGGWDSLLSGQNPLLNIGLGILANNTGNYGRAGPAIGRGMAQGMQQTQHAMQSASALKMMKAQQEEMERRQKERQAQQDSISRLIGGQDAYNVTKDVPVTSFENVPMMPQEGAVAPNFNLQRQETTTMQPQTSFDEKMYKQDIINAGFGDEILKRQLFPAAPELMFAPDGTAINKNDPSLIGRKFEKPEAKPSSLQEYEFAKSQGYQGSYLDFELAQKRAGASVNNVSVNTGQKGFDNTLKLRGDFRSEPIYKAHQDVQSAYSQISTALKQNSPAGDLAGATKLMKILDPGSVVRESELGMAMAASGSLDRLYNYADMVTRGTKLTPNQRKDFQTLADSLYNESVTQYNTKRTEYEGIAERNGLNVQDVLGEAGKIKEKPKSAVNASPLPAKPSSLTLKKGTVYDTPRGPLRWNGKAFEDIE